jgi:shikimate dehydrogenase
MSKQKFCIIGKPVSHSLSPILHNYWFKKYNINAEYIALEINEENLKNVVEKIRDREYAGLNVTLPYKKKIIPYLTKIVNYAKDSSSVNTVYLEGDSVVGENTDVFGLQAGYLKEIIKPKNTAIKALVIGAGGVAPSAIVALKKSNINNISIVNRTYEKSLFLKKQFREIEILKWESYLKMISQFDLIINATSLGLKNGKDFEFLFENVKNELIYIDTIYNPAETKMIKHLKSNNIKAYSGLDMFIYQGQKSFYIWTKKNPEIDEELVNLLKSKIK